VIGFRRDAYETGSPSGVKPSFSEEPPMGLGLATDNEKVFSEELQLFRAIYVVK
jgi:hypothetical protein